MADTYTIMASLAYLSFREILPKSRFLVEKALELDRTLAEAHSSLGLLCMYVGRWSEAEDEFKRALGLNPSYAIAHFWYSILLTWLHRHDEAIAEAKWSEELDPLSPSIVIAVGQALLYARRYDEAMQQLKSAIKANPHIRSSHFILGSTYLAKGETQLALEEAKKAIALSKTPDERIKMFYGEAQAMVGNVEEAKRILNELAEKQALHFHLAGLWLALGDRQKALESLESAYEAQESDLGWLTVLPIVDPLRDDPKFISL